MKIYVALLPELVSSRNLEQQAAVVIDTLRFTTTACQAIAAGAKSVSVAKDVKQARLIAKAESVLCGERNCNRIEGFDLGNSPFEYTPSKVAGRELVFTTTNGTKAVESVVGCKTIFFGSLVNRSAIARLLNSSRVKQLTIVCSGTDGEVTTEDVVTAGVIIAELRRIGSEVELVNDSGTLSETQWQQVSSSPQTLLTCLGESLGGTNLVKSGYSRDLEFAANLDSLNIVPQSSIDDKRKFFACV